jgi:4-hydroxy-2-oxoheptanedioate aldolase
MSLKASQNMTDTPTPLVRNHLQEKLARGELVTSMTVKICRTIEVALVAKTAGFDAIYIDLEHNSLSLDATGQICIAAMAMGVTPLVRLPDAQPGIIGRVLDGGAQGIIVPGLSSAAAAAAVVREVRFSPGGSRGAAGGLPQLEYRNSGSAEGRAAVNATTMVIPMIESREALDDIEAIAAVDGVSFLFIGSADLTADLGIAGEVDSPLLLDAFRRTIAAAAKVGKAVGVGGVPHRPDLMARFVELGARYLSMGADIDFLLARATARVAEARGFATGRGAGAD